MKYFRKQLLAASVMAVACTAVGAADKAPSLGDVLKASGIDITGYLDLTYTHFDTDQTPGAPMAFQANTTEQRSFIPNAADLAISALPANGAGGFVELMAGKDVEFNRSKGWNSSEFDLLQGYAQYAAGSFTGIAGKFTTLAGAEVPQAPSNANISRSLLFTLAIPVTHTGLRAVLAPSDAMKFTVGYNNGWDVVKESATTPSSNCIGATCATGKTLELGAGFNPSKLFGLTAAYYTGDEVGTTAIGTRNLLDVVGTVNLTSALTLVLNYDAGDQEHGAATGGKAKWNGFAGYVNYGFTDNLRGSLRLESFDDKNGFRTGTVQKLKESTLTVGYAVAKSLEVRAEYRTDKSDQQPFAKNGSPTDKQNFYGLESVLKF